MESIPLISEIKPDEIVDEHWYKVYPTDHHKEQDSPWVFPGRDLRAHIHAAAEISRHLELHMLWG